MRFRLLLLFYLFLSIGATAQHDALGVRGGANLSKFVGNAVSGSDITLGYHAGFFYHISIKKDLGFQPELLWFTQGDKTGFQSGVTRTEIRQRLGYVQVPLLLVYTTGDFDGLQLMVGPAVSYLVWAERRTETIIPGIDTTVKEENTSAFPEADLSLQAGIGGLYGGVSIQVRGNYGLLNVSKTNRDIHNLTLMLSVGLEF